MMRRLSAPGLAVAALLAAACPAFSQNIQYPTDQGNSQSPGATMMCVNSAGISVPLALCDQWPSIVKPGQQPGPDSRATVVSNSPSSGATNPYPVGAIPLTESATGTTAGATATFPALSGKTNYLCGFSVSPGSAATAITITITTTGLTNNYSLSVGAPVTAVGTTGTSIVHPITPCVPASAANTAITVVAGALSTSGVGQSVNAWGFAK